MKRLISKGDIYQATGVIRIDSLSDLAYLTKGDSGVFLFKTSVGYVIIKGQITSTANQMVTFSNISAKEDLDVYAETTGENLMAIWMQSDNCWSIAG